jgi:hypothetical protein
LKHLDRVVEDHEGHIDSVVESGKLDAAREEQLAHEPVAARWAPKKRDKFIDRCGHADCLPMELFFMVLPELLCAGPQFVRGKGLFGVLRLDHPQSTSLDIRHKDVNFSDQVRNRHA